MKNRKSIFSLDVRDDHTCGSVPVFQVKEIAADGQGFLIVGEARHV